MINKSKWITTSLVPNSDEYNFDGFNQSIYFRKEFNVNKVINNATLYVSVLGLGVCTVNGEDVTKDVLTTPYTNYDKRIIYNTYDVTNLLKQGKNAVGIHAGNGYYNDNMPHWNYKFAPWHDKPKARATLLIKYADGKSDIIISDTSWKTSLGPYIYNHIRQGEIYDANLRQIGFDKEGFDDALWQDATIAICPGGIMSDEQYTPIRVIKTIKPVSVNNNIYDFGINLSGWAKIKLTAKKGQKIKLIYAEKLLDNGEFCQSNNMYLIGDKMPLLNEEIFIASGKKDEEYTPQFCYYGFRYVKVENAPKDFEISAQLIYSDLQKVGDFTSSDEMLNKIHNASIQATLTNYVGIPTDCPHREQNGWTGDALCSADQSLMNFDMYLFYKKWLRDFTDCQRSSGQVPAIVPTPGYGYTWGCGPSWDSALILIPYKIYLHTHKSDIISLMWDTMVKYMSFLDHMQNDGIVDFGLGDWCPPDWEKILPNAITDSAIYYADLVAMSKMAVLIGEDNKKWLELSQKVKKAWRDNFLNNDKYSTSQTFYACAIYYGLLNDDEVVTFSKKLASLLKDNDYHIDCGILGAKYIFTALSENGYIDYVYKMVTNETFPSYAYWINNGMTTLCERWDMSYSNNHHMFSEVDNWFYRYVGGIKYTEDGLVINPIYLENVNKVEVSHMGNKVVREGKKVEVFLVTPAKIVVGDTIIDAKEGSYEFEISSK